MSLASTTLTDSNHSRRPWTAIILLAALFAAHAFQAVRLFPTPRALWDDDYPVVTVDHAIHLYHGAIGSRFLHEQGTTWGYDPFFMAGYPETPVWDSSSNLSILFQAIAGGGYHPRAYNIGLVVCSILAVAALPIAAMAAGLGVWEAVLATLLGWVYFHCGWPDMFWRSGLFAFVTASCGLVLVIGLLTRFERHPCAGRFGMLVAAGAATWYVHVASPIPALGAVVGATVAGRRCHSWRWWSTLVAAAAVVLVVNLFWLVPLWRFREIRSPSAFFMAPLSGWTFIGQYDLQQLEGFLSLPILILGVLGLVVWFWEGQSTRAAAFGGAALVCLVLAMFGGEWSVTRPLEPLRFRVPLHLILALPAGSALTRGITCLAGAVGHHRRPAVLTICAGLGLAGLAIAMPPQSLAAIARGLMVQRPLVAGVRPEMHGLVRWLAENTDPSARILFEDQLRLYEQTDPESTHWTPLLPVLLGQTRRQFIGGLYQSAFITHHQMASFGDYHLGGRRIDRWPPDRLRDFCKMYNVGWVVCWSPLSRFCFDRLGVAHRLATLPRYHTPDQPPSGNVDEWEALIARCGAELAAQYMGVGEGQYAIYRLERKHSFFLAGEGRLEKVDLNRIEFSDVVPRGGTIALSLHWLDDWRTEPPLQIDPVPIPDSPVPFVRISTPEPLKRLVVYNGYGR